VSDLKLAILGMVDHNGHPYSWSAIFNGYDPAEMAKQPYAGITRYLACQPAATFGIPGARVTHVWTEDPAEAEHIAGASLIPHVVTRPEEVIGQVDAVLIPTDRGEEHVARCRPFVEAGLPIFVDKPLVDNADDLHQFMTWVETGRPIMSSSCMRYAKEFAPFRASTHDLGELRWASVTTNNSWERYGIHALEGVYPILGPGFISARNTGDRRRNIVHLQHRAGCDVHVIAVDDMEGAFGLLQLCGTRASASAAFRDSFYAFKAQLAAFVDFVRTGKPPFPFEQTVELMRIIVAGIWSREQGGREVMLDEV
jgi:predicted dehydrogenase